MADFDLLVLAGANANLLRRAVSVTASDVDSNFPVSLLYDGAPDSPFRWGSNAADRLWTADLSQLVNGDFESSVLVGWTELVSGTGATAEEGTTVHGGSFALRCNGGTGTAERYQDLEVRAGESRRHSVWIRGNGTQSARVRIRNLATGNYYNGSSWVSAAANAAVESSSTYTEHTIDYTVEDWSISLRPTVTIRISYLSTQNGDAYFDDGADFPEVDFLSIHGHNVAPAVAPELRSSTDGFSAVDTLEATLTPYRPGFFTHLSAPVLRRHWRLKLSGTNDAQPWNGEAMLGKATQLSARRGWGYETTLARDQARTRSAAGHVRATALGGATRRMVRWGFPIQAEADFAELRDEVFERSGHGEEPVVFAVLDSDGEQLVIHGRLEEQLTSVRGFVDAWDAELRLAEDPFPIELL